MKAGAVSGSVLIWAVFFGSPVSGQPYVVDRFGRDLGAHGITLVDWDGYLANPASGFELSPPAGAVFPVNATLSANGARLYFDEPSSVGAGGPGKSLAFSDATPQTFRLSIFPDRDGLNETYSLSVHFVDGASHVTNVSVPIGVVDQDGASPQPFAVTVDFSQDASGFFANATRRAIVTQAANDWAYFFAGMNLNAVGVGQESTFIWNYPLAFTGPPPQGYFHNNTVGYTGFLLYAYGIDTPQLRSGGEPGLCCFQHAGGNPLDVRRSGGTQIDMKGNFNTLGWFLTASDDDWWTSANLGGEPNDLYSVAHHEMGHAMAFNSGYPRFVDGENDGFNDDAIVDYQGSGVSVDSSVDHFTGVIDRLSGVGAFGYEYFGDVPRRRWIPTKIDLLLMQSVGYELRATSAFVPLSVPAGTLPNGQAGVAYSASIGAVGGVPFYDWTIDSGALPPGLSLDRFTGAISGTPTATGTFGFDVLVREYDDTPGEIASRSITIVPGCVLGDVDNNSLVNGADVDDFVRVKFAGTGTPHELCATNMTFAAFVQRLLMP